MPRSFDTAAAVPRSFDTAAAVPRSFDTAAAVPRSFDTDAAVGSPFRCSRAAAPSGRSGSPPSVVPSFQGSFSTVQGSPFRRSRAAAPFGRSESPPSIVSSLMAHSATDRAFPSGATEPQLPSVAVRALHLTFQTMPAFSRKRDSPFRCSRTAAPFGCSDSPSPGLPSCSSFASLHNLFFFTTSIFLGGY